MAQFHAVLDASVIIPAPLNDTLLLAAEARLYRVRWSIDILEEDHRNLVSAGLTDSDRAARRIAAMRRAFPRATVGGYQAMIDRMTKHPKDRHVLAATVAAGATIIVTSNLRDFPAHVLAPYGITALSPDQFLVRLDDLTPGRMSAIVIRQASIMRQPPMTPHEVLDHLDPHVPSFVTRLRPMR
jgi:predicted nucleic acid-binding protein